MSNTFWSAAANKVNVVEDRSSFQNVIL